MVSFSSSKRRISCFSKFALPESRNSLVPRSDKLDFFGSASLRKDCEIVHSRLKTIPFTCVKVVDVLKDFTSA